MTLIISPDNNDHPKKDHLQDIGQDEIAFAEKVLRAKLWVVFSHDDATGTSAQWNDDRAFKLVETFLLGQPKLLHKMLEQIQEATRLSTLPIKFTIG